VEVQQCTELTGTNRSIGLIARRVLQSPRRNPSLAAPSLAIEGTLLEEAVSYQPSAFGFLLIAES
jgi:hypothetical protein